MNIYDCFMYFDEDMLLDIRMNILSKYVKKFIIVESKFLHSGKPKKLNFDFNNFAKFKDKIEYIVMEDPPSGIENVTKKDDETEKNRKILDNSLKRENSQRNQLWKGIKKIHDEELIFSSDLDEIPNIENFKYKNKINIFLQKVFYYKFNLQQPDFTWHGTRACKKKDLLSFQWLRNIKSKKYPLWRLDCLFSKKKYFNVNFIKDGGWHFTSIKSPEKIFYKLSNFMHHLEFELSGLNIKNMQELVNQKKILYDHNLDQRHEKYKSEIYLKKVDERVLPKYLQENKEKFIEWFD